MCISGFQRSVFVDSVQSTVKPLVMNIRSIMFSTTYLLLVWAAAMLLCQITARVIFCYLKTSTHLKRTKIYQLPSQCTDGPDRTLYTEEKFENHSVIAESCESGVYDMTNWILAVVSQVCFRNYRTWSFKAVTYPKTKRDLQPKKYILFKNLWENSLL